MINLPTAIQLKQAGLRWRPALHDFFAIPDRQLDDKLFVVSDMLVTVEFLHGRQVVAFQGASEWALDSLATSEAVWMPTEEQLRHNLETALLEAGRPGLRLTSGLGGCFCELNYLGELHKFKGEDASAAYAAGLLYVLQYAIQPPGDGAMGPS